MYLFFPSYFVRGSLEPSLKNNTTFGWFFAAVNTIALTKPEKAKMVESMLVQMAQSGQIQQQVRSVTTSAGFFCLAVLPQTQTEI